MIADNFSRRQLFGGLLAALFGWPFLGRKAARATPPQPAPANPPAASSGGMVSVTTYVYDAHNDPVGKPITRQVPAPATVWHYEYDGCVTTITFREPKR